MNTKHLLTPNLVVFCYEMQEAFKEGFRIDEGNPPSMWGIVYEAVLVKDDELGAYSEIAMPKIESVSVPVKKAMGRPASKGKL